MISKKSLLFSFFILTLCLTSAWASGLKVVLAVSEKIKPYYEAVDGFMAEIEKSENSSIELLEIWKTSKSDFDITAAKLIADQYIYWVAVGPEAVHLVGSPGFPLHVKRIYTMILDPEMLISDPDNRCGISLAISPASQLKSIEANFPWCKTAGLIYDPGNNSFFAEQVMNSISRVTVKPLTVFSRQDIVKILNTNLVDIDLLWMIPDPIVISESLVPYIIKRAMERNVAVVGFNRFFLRKGAAAAFIIDYKAIGKEAAKMITALHEGKECKMAEPPWALNIDTDVINLLGK